jgi:predicted nuclease with TOPRIM domain
MRFLDNEEDSSEYPKLAKLANKIIYED